MSTDSAIRRFTKTSVSDDGGKKGKTQPPRLAPLEVMMSAEYKEWSARKEELEREIELLKEEEAYTHKQLVDRWFADDPALELNSYNLKLLAKIKRAKQSLQKHWDNRPKGVT